ncbi:MarR family winged helix-turn-helix transcriptional regulator [Salidesulfovibrio onnuriiensis]|uniref:MarR family winged helix-turn-helix transcriptional regulator n=1 Tax=Salidesulfovibrio onnuriiensis TaxID=2583823 RepID=UPI0011C93451|nr:MarR family transcriptional regulator [Salidesulfovibrio onnuriiensis]
MRTTIEYDYNESIGLLLAVASQSMRLHLSRRFAAAGLDISPEQWRVMMATWISEGLSQRELADRCFMNKVSITKILESLEKRELIQRERSEEDRRGNRVFLTDAGHALHGRMVEAAKQNLRQAEQGIDPDDLQTFRAVARKIIANMKP